MGLGQVVAAVGAAIGFDRFHAVGASRHAGIHLAAANLLSIGGLDDEVMFAVLRFAAFESAFATAVLSNRLHTVRSAGFGFVTFAGQNVLAIGGFQSKVILAVVPRINLKLSRHIVAPINFQTRRRVWHLRTCSVKGTTPFLTSVYFKDAVINFNRGEAPFVDLASVA